MRSFFRQDKGNRIIRNTFTANMIAFILSSLTSSIGSLIDGVVIGQFLGVDAMAAFGLVSPVVIIFALIGAVVASGARNRFTMMIGSGDMEGARGIYTLSLILGVGVSALVMAVVFVFADPICIGLGASGSAAGLLGQARGYLLGLALGLPAMNASRVMQNYMAIDNDRQLTVISSLVLTLVDIVLDVLIAASGGSTFGMGLATSLSHYAALGVLLTHLRRQERLIRFSLKDVRLKEAGAVRAAYHLAIEMLESCCRDAARILEEAEPDALAYLDFPASHWKRLRTDNVQERANREIKRRSRVVQVFPSVASLE